ncbi:MAG: hypothetical protein JWP37_2217, partial [Mucilaginibacter sp.]|nr:hypothetical protein [Mucilaginibacter sp.]
MDTGKVILLHITDLHFGDDLGASYSIQNFTFFNFSEIIIEKLKELAPSELIIAIG